MKSIPEKLIAYNAYDEAEALLGMGAEFTLPNFESVTTEIAGPGILGTIESPTPGHFGSQVATLTFRTLTKEAAKLNEPRVHTIILRGSQSSYDLANGETIHRALKVVFRGRPKNFTGGKLKAGESTETAVDLEMHYIKITEGDDVLLELDKYNYIYVVNNTDYLAEVRNNI